MADAGKLLPRIQHDSELERPRCGTHRPQARRNRCPVKGGWHLSRKGGWHLFVPFGGVGRAEAPQNGRKLKGGWHFSRKGGWHLFAFFRVRGAGGESLTICRCRHRIQAHSKSHKKERWAHVRVATRLPQGTGPS